MRFLIRIFVLQSNWRAAATSRLTRTFQANQFSYLIPQYNTNQFKTMTDIVPDLVITPRKPLAPLQKVTPRQEAVASAAAATTGLNKSLPPTATTENKLVGETDSLPVDLTSNRSESAEELYITGADSSAPVILPPIANGTTNEENGTDVAGTIAKGTIVGDQEHLFWRKNLEVHIRVWELQTPACYAAQIHATDDKRDLGVVYMNKEAVDTALDSNYIINGGGNSSKNTKPRFTMQMSDLKNGADEAELADSARLTRHYEQVMKLVIKNLNITGTDTNKHQLNLAAKGGQPSPYIFVGENPLANIAARQFNAKPSRAEVIENFQKIQAEFSAQLDTVKNATDQAQQSNDHAKEIHHASVHMSSPVRLEKILKRVRLRSMLKVKALGAFSMPRTTL